MGGLLPHPKSFKIITPRGIPAGIKLLIYSDSDGKPRKMGRNTQQAKKWGPTVKGMGGRDVGRSDLGIFYF
jgi:hypothetical protein